MSRVPDLLRRLQNAYSLRPHNSHLPICLDAIIAVSNEESFHGLQASLRQFTAVHISCEARVDRARASVASFLPLRDDEAHIVVVGSQTVMRDSQFSFNDGLLTIPVSDAYECLIQKVLYAVYLVSAAGGVETLAKFDDDVRMTSRGAFDDLLSRIAASPDAYHGAPLPAGHHMNYWHGWHVGKCSAPWMEGAGLQVPLPPVFASGGHGYFLKSKAIDELRYAFLSQRLFHTLPTGWAEDALVGLHLHLGGISLAPLEADPTGELGFRADHHESTTDWARFNDRLRVGFPSGPGSFSVPGAGLTVSQTGGPIASYGPYSAVVSWEVPNEVAMPISIKVAEDSPKLFAVESARKGQKDTGDWVVERLRFELFDADGRLVARTEAPSPCIQESD